MCSKLAVKTPDLVTRTSFYCRFTPCSCVSIVNFEHVIAGWFRSSRVLGTNDSGVNSIAFTQ